MSQGSVVEGVGSQENVPFNTMEAQDSEIEQVPAYKKEIEAIYAQGFPQTFKQNGRTYTPSNAAEALVAKLQQQIITCKTLLMSDGYEGAI